MPTCCVVGCSRKPNTSMLSKVRFHRFPRDRKQRQAWISALNRDNWKPSEHSRLCSFHFIHGTPSKDPSHPDWAPSIFPHQNKESHAESKNKWQNKTSNSSSPSKIAVNLLSHQENCSVKSNKTDKGPSMRKEDNDLTSSKEMTKKTEIKPKQVTITFIRAPKQNVGSTSITDSKINLTASTTSSSAKNTQSSVSSTSLSLQKFDHLQQLSTNVLAPFVPSHWPPAHLDLSIPPEGYNCRDCGDTFLIESSLTQHLSRQSVLISFPCDTCNSSKVFYNRCALLAHIREHQDKGEVVDIRKATVSPLPRELMDESKLSALNIGNTSKTDENLKLPSSKSSEANISESSAAVQPISDEQHQDLEQISCLECSLVFDSIKAREDHFNSGEKVPLCASQCNKCAMICPSRCSLKAHKRIHFQRSPYICPECGERIWGTWERFQDHLKLKCLHFFRTSGIKCSLCNQLHTSTQNLMQHTFDVHTESYYKCQACPMAFKAATTFNSHKRSAHMTYNVQYKIIFKCSLCEVVFLTKEQLQQHLDIHMKDHVSIFIFSCSECNTLAETKSVLRCHMEDAHSQLMGTEMCSFCDAKFLSSQALGKHKKELHGFIQQDNNIGKGKECTVCRSTFLSMHSYNLHWQRCHGAGSLHCSICGISTSDKTELVTHSQWHLSKGAILCLVCNSSDIDGREALITHLEKHVNEMKYPIKCFHCGQLLVNKHEGFEHLKKEHHLSQFFCNDCDFSCDTEVKLVRHRKVMHETRTGNNFICWICKEHCFNKLSLLTQHISLVHNIPKDQIDLNKLPHPPIKIRIPIQAVKSSGETEVNVQSDNGDCPQLPKRPRVSHYSCSKCIFKSTERKEFRSHILKHKKDKSSSQCQECGTCFVVQPSLWRHLVTVHKIPNVKEYLAAEALETKNEKEEKSNSGLLECDVCSTSFPNETVLKIHMRSHGMAFIKAARTSNK